MSSKNKNIDTAINKLTSNKYIKLFNENLKDKSMESVIDAISALNAYTLCLSDSKIDKDLDSIEEFYYYFLDNYYSQPLEAKMRENWDDVPRILSLAMYNIEERERKLIKKSFDALDNVSKQNVLKINDYIWSKRTERKIYLEYNRNEEHVHSFLNVPSVVPKKSLQLFKNDIAYHIAHVMFNGGIMLFSYQEDDFIVTNGFAFDRKHVFKMDPEVLHDLITDNNEIFDYIDLDHAKYEVANKNF